MSVKEVSLDSFRIKLSEIGIRRNSDKIYVRNVADIFDELWLVNWPINSDTNIYKNNCGIVMYSHV